MKIKADRQFEDFCALMRKRNTQKVGEELGNLVEDVALLAPGFIVEYPFTIGDCINELGAKNIRDMFHQYFKADALTVDKWAALMNLTVIGDGDCPECGGHLEWARNDFDEEYIGKNVFGEEKYRRIAYRVMVCPDCGYEQKEQD